MNNTSTNKTDKAAISSIKVPCQFNEWHFNPIDGQLKSKKYNLRLQPRHSKLLAIFCANSNVVLSRDQLIKILWQEKAVNEDALSRCVAELRALLGDKHLDPVYIETLPKKGYRFKVKMSAKQSIKKRLAILVAALSLISLIAVSLINVFVPQEILSNNVTSKNTHSKEPIITSQFKTALISATRITTDIDIEHQPKLSSKGNMLAFSVRKESSLIVKIIDLKGNVLHKIIDPEQDLLSATFSPNDQFLLIAGISPAGCKIYLYQLSQSKILQNDYEREFLGHCMHPIISGIFDWHPSNKQFAFVAESEAVNNNNEKRAAIWVFDLQNKHRTQITNPVSINSFDSRPIYSPNGQQLAFTRGTTSIRNIFIADQLLLNNNEQESAQQITQHKGFIYGFNWTKDAKHLLYDSNALGDRSLVMINIIQKKPILLGARNARFPSLNTNNTKLAYHDIQYNANIWSIDINQENVFQPDNPAQPNSLIQPIIESIKYNNFPNFSPDGKQIVFTSNREGKAGIWLYSFKTKQQTKLLSIKKLDLVLPSWSPSGNKIIVTSRGKGGYKCYEINLINGKHHEVLGLKSPLFSCIYSNENEIFAITKETSKVSNIIKLTRDNQNRSVTQLITDFAVSRVQFAHNNRLIYTLEKEDGIYSMDLNGENKKIEIENYPKKSFEKWAIQGHYLYYPKIKEGKGIWQYDLLTGIEKKVSNEQPNAIGYTLSVNPQHTQMIMSKTDQILSDIYLAEIKADPF